MVEASSNTISQNTSGNAATVTNGVYTTSSVTALSDVSSAGSGAIITTTERNKLNGIASGATANSTDAYLLSRSNHTGTQTAATISDFDTEVANNTAVAANTAKNSYPSADASKLAGIEAGADVTDAANVLAAGAVMTTGTQQIGGAKTFQNDVVITGDLTVNGTTTTINSTNVSVDDKMIELGAVATPSDTTANGGGIKVLTGDATQDPTIQWNSTQQLGGFEIYKEGTAASAGYISLMSFSTSPATGTPTAGQGMFHTDTSNSNLYIYM